MNSKHKSRYRRTNIRWYLSEFRGSSVENDAATKVDDEARKSNAGLLRQEVVIATGHTVYIDLLRWHK